MCGLGDRLRAGSFPRAGIRARARAREGPNCSTRLCDKLETLEVLGRLPRADTLESATRPYVGLFVGLFLLSAQLGQAIPMG